MFRLRGICEDSIENVGKILDNCGMIPFMSILSIWSAIDYSVLGDVGGSNFVSAKPKESNSHQRPNKINTRESPVPMLFANPSGVCSDERDILESRLLPTKQNSTTTSSKQNKSQDREFYRLQLTTARFIKQLITGFFGEYHGISQPALLSTPTGFSISHLNSLLNFVMLSITW